jgi:hypothetical protein
MHQAGTPRAIPAAMNGGTKLRGRCILARIPLHGSPALLLVASFLGCGGLVGSGPSQLPPQNITVTVAPAASSLLLGETRSFTSTVSNAANTAVSWSVNGIPGGNATFGTIDAGGVYTAPQILTAPPSFALTAVSVADPSKSGTATITLSSSFSLAVAGPSSAMVGKSANYTATLTPAANSNPIRVISWSVAGTGCSGAACGTISSSGMYTAPSLPPSPATVQIIATPRADPSKAAAVSVSILAVIGVSISPSSATVALGAAQAFQAAVTGAQDATVTWDVNGVVDGNSTVGLILNSQTDPDHTMFTAPQTLPAGGSVTVHARSNANPGISASANITFTAALEVTLSPANATLAISHTQRFTAHVYNASNQNVAWLVNGVLGGNATTGQICAAGSNPCQSVSVSNGGSVDYVAPAGLPSPNPVNITATSQADSTQSASASVTILSHIVVSVQPGTATLSGTGQDRFAAGVAGTDNQQVFWSIAGAGCSDPAACGSVDSTGLYTAPPAAPSPDLIEVIARSSEDESQTGTATVTIARGPAIFSLSPTSAYAGSAGGFTLLVSGIGFSSSTPGPGSTVLVAGTTRATSCSSSTQCITSPTAANLQSAGTLSVQLQNPDGTLSNTQTFVVLAPGSATGTIPLTPSAPTSLGNDIVVVELSTNGGSGVAENVSLNIAAIGPYSVATGSCLLGGSPVIIQRPSAGTGAADMCVYSVSALDRSFAFTISGPPTPDITVSNREPLGLGILHLTLQVPATAAPGARTLFVENPEGDKAAGTGVIEVR